MTIAIVIGTHGWAAEQLLKTAEMLLGEQENVGWIDFVPGENAETLIEKYNAQLAKLDTSKGVLFLVDTWGGSPLHRLNQDDPEGISGIRLDYTESNERKLRVGEGLRRLMCSMRNDASKNLKRSTSYCSANNAILFAPIKTTVKCLKTIFKF